MEDWTSSVKTFEGGRSAHHPWCGCREREQFLYRDDTAKIIVLSLAGRGFRGCLFEEES
jgi:hypothetical protein